MPPVAWKVPYLDLKKEVSLLGPVLMEAVSKVLSSGEFILRAEVAAFEARIQALFQLPSVVGLNSGTDALYLAMQAAQLGPGDEVITTAHTFVATVASIVHVGAKPAFVDIGDDFNMDPNLIFEKITKRTKAILPVHLNGRSCRMDAIMKIASENNLTVIEDAAQAIGASYQDKSVGSFGDFGCFSLHPMKILNAAGDAGFICANNSAHLDKIRVLRNHGQISKDEISCFGWNSRLDNLQAAIINVKIPYLGGRIKKRRELAKSYYDALHEIEGLRLPPPPSERGPFFDVFSSYVIRCSRRDDLAQYLRNARIEVFSHWKRPLHRQPALYPDPVSLPKTEQISSEVLSLPIFPEMTDKQQNYVVENIRKFYLAKAHSR